MYYYGYDEHEISDNFFTISLLMRELGLDKNLLEYTLDDITMLLVNVMGSMDLEVDDATMHILMMVPREYTLEFSTFCKNVLIVYNEAINKLGMPDLCSRKMKLFEYAVREHLNDDIFDTLDKCISDDNLLWDLMGFMKFCEL